MDDDNPLEQSRRYWDAQAAEFDREPDHGLLDPAVRSAWTALLCDALPPPPAAVLDLGCGTGSLSVLLAGLGYPVTGIDFSPRMVDLARQKAQHSGLPVEFQVMDAAVPQFPPGRFGALVCRHLL